MQTGESVSMYQPKFHSNGPKVPTLLKEKATAILNLVDLIAAGTTPQKKKAAAIEEVKKIGADVRNAWCVLHQSIRAGRYSWEQVQGFGVDGYTKEMVEGYIREANINGRASGSQGFHRDDMTDEAGNISNTDHSSDGELVEHGASDGRSSDDDTLDSEPKSSSSPTILTEAFAKLMDSINSVNETVVSIAESSIKPHEEIKTLLESVIQLQEEMVEGQKDMLANQKEVTEAQKELIKEVKKWMTSKQKVAKKEKKIVQPAPVESSDDLDSDPFESHTPLLAEMVDRLSKSVQEVEASSPLEKRSRKMGNSGKQHASGSSKKEPAVPQPEQVEQPPAFTKRKRASAPSGWMFKPTSLKKLNTSKKKQSFESAGSSVSRKLKFDDE